MAQEIDPITGAFILLGDAIAALPDTRSLSQQMQNIRNTLIQKFQELRVERDMYKARAESAENRLKELTAPSKPTA